MTPPMDDKQARSYLAAFADGELDVEQNLLVLEHMAMNPVATRRVMHQQQLRQLTDRCLRAHLPGAPQALRRSIERLAVRPQRRRPSVLARIGRWAPPAVAALLLLSAVMVYQADRARPPRGNVLLTADKEQSFARRHVRCTRELQTIRNAALYPHSITELPATITRKLPDARLPVLDLSAIGYAFKQAGDCSIPGSPSVHLIYASIPGSGHSDSLSLWIAPYTDQPTMESDRLYHVNSDRAPHPMLVWRQGSTAYYLVADDPVHAEQAAQALRRAG